MAGLLDQYTFADNTQALKMTKWMVEYFYNRVQNVITKYSVERHWNSLNEETGGMNDVLYRLYTITVCIPLPAMPLSPHLTPHFILKMNEIMLWTWSIYISRNSSFTTN